MSNLIKLDNNKWILEIDLNGGRIKELKYDNEVILGTFQRIDGKMANTHVCIPNFGNEGVEKFGLPFHGPFRNVIWSLIENEKNQIIIEAVIEGLKVRQRFLLDKDFEQEILVENLSNEERLVNVAIHNYWDSKNGWQGIKLNGKIIDSLIRSDISQSLPQNNLLEIPKKLSIKWEVWGFKYSQFWTGIKNKGGNNIYDQNYVCVEPSLEEQGFLDKGEINLGIGKTIKLGQKIGVVYRT